MALKSKNFLTAKLLILHGFNLNTYEAIDFKNGVLIMSKRFLLIAFKLKVCVFNSIIKRREKIWNILELFAISYNKNRIDQNYNPLLVVDANTNSDEDSN